MGIKQSPPTWYPDSLFYANERGIQANERRIQNTVIRMVVPIIAVVLVALTVAYCIKYRRRLRHQQGQQTPAQGQHTPAQGQHTPAPSQTPAPAGLRTEEIEMFAISIYAPAQQEGTTAEDNTFCPICREPYEPGQQIRELPCMHGYHAACIDGWLSLCRTCPDCRRAF